MTDGAARDRVEAPPLWRTIVAWAPDGLVRAGERRPALVTLADIASLLVVFVVFDRIVERLTRLPETAYAEPVIALGLLGRTGPVVGLAAVLGAIVLLRYGRLASPWQALAPGRALKGFVVALAGIMAWTFSAYDYNYYFDQHHLVDRLLVLALLVASAWRPVFVIPLTAMLYAMMWQTAEPNLGGSIYAHKLQVLRVLNLFCAAMLLHALTGRRRFDVFVFLCACLVAGAYFEAALAKFELGWFGFGHLERLPLAAWPHGWLGFAQPETIVKLAAWLASFDWPLRIFVLGVEAACLFFLVRRGVTLALLAAVVVFHLGVFALYGFFFWTWIALDVALFALLLADSDRRLLPHDRTRIVTSVALIALAAWWARPPHLGWYDTTLTYTYPVYGTDTAGETFRLPPQWFGPYQERFTMMAFSYLSPHGVLVGPYGVTHDRAAADALDGSLTASEIVALESELGLKRYNEARAGRLAAFLRTWVSHRNARGEVAGIPAWLQVPPQFFSQPREPGPTGRPIAEVTVVEVTTALIDGRLEQIRRMPVATVPIPR